MFYFGKSNKSLGDLFDDFLGIEIKRNYLRSDLIENDNNYELTVEIPGIEKSDINISYENKYLTITANKKQIKENVDNYIQKEIQYGSYTRKYFLENIDSDKIKASYNNGILNVLIPKLQVDNKHKTINIE
ncbi:MAG TPA: Hsp20/alpha crystallin family protein [Acholeplasmataceae bacterium]|nr:Hsp20/alpha crystallin family protein [Acholeplasmataceae bacterium]